MPPCGGNVLSRGTMLKAPRRVNRRGSFFRCCRLWRLSLRSCQASSVFYTQKSLFHRLAQGGKEQALAKYEQSAIPIAQRQVAWWRIASAAQMAAEPPDQCDSFAKVFRCLDSFFFA